MGDQQMTQGNRAILDHEAEDRDLQLFVAHGTELEYVGCFRDHDHYEADAPEIGTEEIRKVIVFRLEQLDGTDAGPKRTRPDRLGIEKVKEIPVEQQITETTLIEGSRDPHEVERREQKLVQRVAEHLEDAGHDVCRLQLRPEEEAAPIFCDLYDKSTRTVYEAKGSVARPAIRMAIGQLADYSRLIDPSPNQGLLLPQEPRPDLLNLIASQGIAVVWPDDHGFTEPSVKLEPSAEPALA